MTNPEQLLPPGFRFHPTDEELILHYLKNKATSTPCPVSIIAEVDIYKFDPWDLPAKAMFGDREWYFFTPRDRKYPNGIRPNRAAGSGYWKATGTDKPISTNSHGGSGKGENIGVKKALVFYKGKPPKGTKTNWIMHEYRLAESGGYTNHHIRRNFAPLKQKDCSMRLDDWVLCRIYEKSNHHAMQGSDQPCVYESNFDESLLQAQPSELRLPKIPSLSDLFLPDSDYSVFSRIMHDGNLLDVAGAQGLFASGYATTIHNPNPSLEDLGGVKRQRSQEGFAGEGPSSKKYPIEIPSNTSFTFSNQLGPTQFSSINQSYPNPQIYLQHH